ncbi:MAG: sigma-54-dependent Fis family transcriptional regulator [Alphaproteobacteria bacterium]|nr:sigma-54-dependent Fis family transcriptional regulator [Alphaproteobacteria bacterium]
MPRILVVDDEAANRVTLERILRREGWEVAHAPDGRSGLERLRTDGADVVITDLKMPGMSGLELLRAIKAVAPDVEVLVMTAYGTVETAVEAMKEGAYDYVTKPLRRMELVGSIGKALEKRGLILENRRLREALDEETARTGHELIGSSPAMRQLLEELTHVAPSDASVLLVGESGTGKSVLARLVHRRSRRRDGRFVTLNCAALPEALLEAELFGHEAGAFTGATARKEGRVEAAGGGTLFLDEVTEIPPSAQVKLLRVLQEGEFERLGSTRTLQADLRVIAATNRDIQAEVAAGRFREDLYYRLNVIQLRVPPLRERPEDIPLLAAHFLSRYREKNQKRVSGFSPEALDALAGYRWPGNVRELENAVERSVVLSRSELVGLEDLPPAVRQGQGGRPRITFQVGTPLKVVERRMIEETLRSVGGDKTLAANLLGITARTIYRREAEWSSSEPSSD